MTIGQNPRADINRPLAQLDESENAGVSFPLAMSEMAQLMVGDLQDNILLIADAIAMQTMGRENWAVFTIVMSLTSSHQHICHIQMESEGSRSHAQLGKTGFCSASSCNNTINTNPLSLHS